jgi:hypothetical protein
VAHFLANKETHLPNKLLKLFADTEVHPLKMKLFKNISLLVRTVGWSLESLGATSIVNLKIIDLVHTDQGQEQDFQISWEKYDKVQ